MIYKLKELSTIKRGSSPRPINDYISKSGYPWLKISDFSINDKVVDSTKEFIKEEGLKNTRYVKKGTLIVTNSATPGIPIFLGKNMCLHDGFLYFEELSTMLDKEYLYYFILCNRRKLVGLGNGSVFINLKKEILENYEIDLPSIELQRKIARYLSLLDDKIQQNNKINDNLSNYSSTESTSISPDISFGKSESRNEDNAFISFSNCLISSIIGKANALNLIMSSS